MVCSSFPAKIVPTVFAVPMTAIAKAPKADVVLISMLASNPSSTMGPHISMINAGKYAVTNASWKPQEKSLGKLE